MSYGYSAKLVKLNSEADGSRLGVALGRVCIARDISVSHVASVIGVSRQTVYNWFCGTYEPSTYCKNTVVDLTAEYKSSK